MCWSPVCFLIHTSERSAREMGEGCQILAKYDGRVRTPSVNCSRHQHVNQNQDVIFLYSDLSDADSSTYRTLQGSHYLQIESTFLFSFNFHIFCLTFSLFPHWDFCQFQKSVIHLHFSSNYLQLWKNYLHYLLCNLVCYFKLNLTRRMPVSYA